MADRVTHECGWTQERKQTHEVDWLTHHHNQEGTPAHKVEWLAFEHSLTQDGAYSRGQNKVYIPFSFYSGSTARNVPFRFFTESSVLTLELLLIRQLMASNVASKLSMLDR